jgi:hypothetical protein
MAGFWEGFTAASGKVWVVAELLKKINPIHWVVVGYGIPAVVLWLMIFKPF